MSVPSFTINIDKIKLPIKWAYKYNNKGFVRVKIYQIRMD